VDAAFTTVEQQRLAPFVTSLDRPILGLRQLPEVVKGALFSRYSRSEKSLRRILLDEFLQSAEAGLEDWVSTEAGGIDAAKALFLL
jgi:hypothetical protein